MEKETRQVVRDEYGRWVSGSSGRPPGTRDTMVRFRNDLFGLWNEHNEEWKDRIVALVKNPRDFKWFITLLVTMSPKLAQIKTDGGDIHFAWTQIVKEIYLNGNGNGNGRDGQTSGADSQGETSRVDKDSAGDIEIL